MNREDKGSLSWILKNKGLINFIDLRHFREGRGINFFNIEIDLTEDGLLNIDEIITLVFQYLNMIKMEGPYKRIFDVRNNFSFY